MAVAFTEEECNSIREALRSAARICARGDGMRSITVEQLARTADISKGAFYKFYESKEMLFLEILEEMHAEVYGRAAQLVAQNTFLPPHKRAAQAILDVCTLMEESGMMMFWERDLPVLLDKLPKRVLAEHYHDDEVHILGLLRMICPEATFSQELTAATVRTLMLTISHRSQIGPCYPQVMETLVRGACDQLFCKET